MALKWGIASAGLISHDFTNALTTLPTSDHQVVAVAAREHVRAQKFATKFNIPKAHEGYLALAKDPDVEIVYIGTLNPQHLEVASLMLENGKHVLCEKPLTLNKKQSQKLVDLAKKKNLFLMEAVWSRAFPAYKELRKQIDAGVIGDIHQVIASFGFAMSDVERLQEKELGGGTVLDLGVYILQFQQFVFGAQKPIKVVANGHLNQSGVDESISAIITYPGGKTATVLTHSKVTLPNEAFIIGTKGTIKIPNFWCPTKLILPDGEKDYPLPEAKIPFNYTNSAGLRYEAEEARECIKIGLKENPSITLAESLQLAELEDELRKQVGVVYPQDSE